MLFQIAYQKKFTSDKILARGERFSFRVDTPLDFRYGYKLRVRGGANVPYVNRTEDVFPLYYRKLDDSLVLRKDAYTLEFNARNSVFERSCYSMLRGDFPVGKELTLSFLCQATGVKDDLFIQAEIYYGANRTRYYYETPDESYSVAITDSNDYVCYEKKILLTEHVDFIMLKISGVGFDGQASFYAPKLVFDGTDYAYPFTYEPEVLRGQKWMGEGFSWTERPYFTVFVNGEKAFEGTKTDCLQCLCGVEFVLPQAALREKDNEFTIVYGDENSVAYRFGEVQLLRLPKRTEILGYSRYQKVGKPFGVFCYFAEDTSLSVECDPCVRYAGKDRMQKGYGVLKFEATELAKNARITIRSGQTEQCIELDCISERNDNVLTGSGDFIYVPQTEEAFAEYLAWYLNEEIGNMLTFRSCYRWAATSEADPVFWEKAVSWLCDLGIYYVLMIDGRELNGVNANPKKEWLQSPYFLGEQTHERDGAFTYWVQEADEYEALFYHLLSRKLKRNGIYGKYSPVYNQLGEARIYYAEDAAKNVKQAHENFVENLRKTVADGATRHTGVTPLFQAFFQAGYSWLGLESMYGNHELLFGALRGMSRTHGQESYGAHLALQWSSVPCDDPKHAERYRLSLYMSYMHGVSQINTEEGLWNIENPFEGFDRFSRACRMHVREQSRFNRFVKTHERRGRLVTKIAMMVGKYDGMDCFSTGSVYGQKEKYWAYASPEESWDLVKVFYPQAVIGSSYHFVKKGGLNNLRKKDKEFLDAWGYMFGEVENYAHVKDYRPLGYYTETPYGAIDLIADDAQNLGDYSFIFMLGWNSCSEEWLERLCGYLEKGGRLLLAKPHLYGNVDREEVFTGKGKPIESPWLTKLLSYRDTGSLVLFDEDKYPSEIGQAYCDCLRKEGERLRCPYLSEIHNVSYTEYEQADGSKTLYLLNIGWWTDEPATAKLTIDGKDYALSLHDTYIKILAVSASGKTAVLCSDERLDLCRVSDESFLMRGFAQTDVTVFQNGEERVLRIRVKGEKELFF